MAKKSGAALKKKSVKHQQMNTASLKAISEKQTKGQIVSEIAKELGNLSKKEVANVLIVLGQLIVRHMKKRGSGEFTIPYTGIRVRRRTRPATKKRMGRNPATGESIMIAAKPARTVVKVAALKSLKESVNQ